jgi:Flp pilus assembly protein CpaB
MIGARRLGWSTPRSRRGMLWIALGLLLAAGAAVATMRLSARSAPTTTVLVARVAIPAGTLLDAARAQELLALAAVPADLRLAGLLRDPRLVLGRRTAAPVAGGEPLTEAALGGAAGTGPAPLGPGERALAIPLQGPVGSAAGVVPGGRVDVVASAGDGAGGRSVVIASGAEVMAVNVDDQAVERGQGNGLSVTLRVSLHTALRLSAALNFAREVRVLVRPPAERGSALGLASRAPGR